MSAQLDFPMIDAQASAPDVKRQTFKDLVISQFKAEEPALLAIASKYKGVAFDCTTTKGMDAAKAARLETREQGRFKIQRAADQAKADANDLKRVIDSESERLISLIKPVEDEIHSQIKAEEDRKAAEKAERERLAAERKALHEGKMANIRACVERAKGLPSERIANGIAQVEALAFGDDCGDFLAQYEAAKTETLTAMRALLAEAQAREASEAQRLENERVAAELAAQKKALEDQAAELLRQRVAATHAIVFAFPEPEAPTHYPNGAPMFSSTVFKENGEPIMLDEHGKRSVFCDLCDDMGDDQAAATEITEAQPPQQVLKAEPAPVLADATDRDQAVNVSPRGGAMGAGQAAAAAPAGGPVAGIRVPQPDSEPPAPLPPAKAEAATLKLGTICERLGITMTAAFVADTLGIAAAGSEKRAVLYRESDFGLICDALVIHAQKCKTKTPKAISA